VSSPFRFCAEIWASELTLVPELESKSEISDISSGDGPLGDRKDFSFFKALFAVVVLLDVGMAFKGAMRGGEGY